MKKTLVLSYFFFLLIFLFSSCEPKESKIASEKALDRLIKGNERFVNNKSLHTNQNEERRKAIASQQSPYAIIVGCSDSRVSPEIIFDEGLGDLFVVRVAGNIIGPIELESIEYAALYLNSAIILILSHENCGAVEAVIQNKITDIEEIAKIIKPAIQKAEESKTNQLGQAIKINALNMKSFLEKSSKIEQLIRDKKIEVLAAYYNIKTGHIELLNE
ncbi:MAG: carbonic anhydrase [Chlamydiae bacterium]|nr:carbonic anhydrase [Chlamydiota bacterium]